MKIYRYNRISSVPNTMEIVACDMKFRSKFDTSLADLSFFQPTGESVRNMSRIGDVNMDGYYDFPDGKDNGMKIPKARIKGSDIAEISTEIKSKQDVIREVKGVLDDANSFRNKLKGGKTTIQNTSTDNNAGSSE